MRNKLINYSVLISFVLATSGCAGHDANPVMIAQYGDDGMSCKALEIEMSDAQQQMQSLVGQTDKTGQNVALGVAGWFLLVPWFFMDFKNGEKQEYESWRQRYNHLAILATEKHCGIKKVHVPTAAELQKAAKQKKREEQGDQEDDYNK